MTEATQRTVESERLGFVDRLKAVKEIVVTGRVKNPLADAPEPSRADLVQYWTKEVKSARKFWKPIRDRINEDIRFAAGRQWPETYGSLTDEPYQEDVVQRQIQQKLSTLYAKNPTVNTKQRKRRDFLVWDGTQESLQGARQAMAQWMMQDQQMMIASGEIPAPDPAPVKAMAVLADYEHGMERREQLRRLGETLELVFDHQLDNQNPTFKGEMKNAVARAITTGVAYCHIMYRRDVETEATQSAEAPELATHVAAIQSQTQRLLGPDRKLDEKGVEELRLLLEGFGNTITTNAGKVLSEGLVFDFPKTTSIIVDPACRCLVNFVGARWLAEELMMTVEDAEQEFGVDLHDCGATVYHEGEEQGDRFNRFAEDGEAAPHKARVCIWRVWDKRTRMLYVLCDGVQDFLREPALPQPQLEAFWPFEALTLQKVEVEENDPDNDVTCYPRSDVRLMRPMQRDINTAGEGLREHRLANRPGWVAIASRWMERDLDKLAAARASNTVLRLSSFNPGEKVSDFLQPIPTQPIDPNLYSPSPSMAAVLRVVGSQEANLGPTAGATATEASIAEGSRLTSVNSNKDDVDDFISRLAKKGGEILLSQMKRDTVLHIVGPGAVWPELSMEEIRGQIYLEVEAGSSGPVNQAVDMNVAKQMIPLLIQVPGIDPEAVARFGMRVLDPRLDISDFFRKGLPSIQAMNSGPSIGPAETPTGPPGAVPPQAEAVTMQG